MLVLLASLVSSGCDNDVIELGLIENIDVPRRSTIGAPIVVRITTEGVCGVSFERTDVEVTPDFADVFPLDRRSGSDGGACPLILYHFEHEATVRFDTAGAKAIRIHSRSFIEGAYQHIRVDFSVEVE
jgi:hypothetical protein